MEGKFIQSNGLTYSPLPGVDMLPMSSGSLGMSRRDSRLIDLLRAQYAQKQ